MDEKLSANVKMARARKKDNPLHFALVLKGADGALLVDKKKVAKNEITEAKKKSGGSTVVSGVCYGGDDGQLIFATAKVPAPAWAAAVKKIATRDAGVAIKPEFIHDVEQEAGEDDGEHETPPQAPPSPPVTGVDPDEQKFRARLQICEQLMGQVEKRAPDKVQPLQVMLNLARKRDAEKNYKQGLGVLAELTERLKAALQAPVIPPAPPLPGDPAAFTARLKALLPKIQAAVTAKAPGAEEAKLKASEAGALSRQGDLAQANRLLNEVERLLLPPKAPPPPQNGVATVMQRLKTLTGPIKEALAGPNAARVQTLFGAVNGLIKNNDAEQAGKVLDELEAVVGRGIPEPPPPPEFRPPPPAPKTDPRAAEWKGRLKELTAAIKKAIAADGPNAGALQDLFEQTQFQGGGEEFERALQSLDELELLLADAEPPALVAFAKTRLRWNQAKQTVKTRLADLRAAVLDEYDDPEALKAVGKLKLVLDRLDEGLADSLDELANSDDPKEQADLRKRLLTIGDNYLKYLESDAIVALVEENPYLNVGIRATLTQPLKVLQRQVNAIKG